MDELSVSAIVEALDLTPHPEGGYYREVYRDESADTLTTIYFLLEADMPSRWHRVLGSAEVWFYQGGAPLWLHLSKERPVQSGQSSVLLGPAIAEGHHLQATVPPDVWQMAETTGAWSLVSCAVAPAFSFERFELLQS